MMGIIQMSDGFTKGFDARSRALILKRRVNIEFDMQPQKLTVFSRIDTNLDALRSRKALGDIIFGLWSSLT